jgi:hypothetical protein
MVDWADDGEPARSWRRANGCLWCDPSSTLSDESDVTSQFLLRGNARRLIFIFANQLVQIWSKNEQALAALRTARRKMHRARSYLNRANCNRLLGQAYLDRATRIQGRVLAQLRRDQRAGWDTVDRLDKLLDAWACKQTRFSSVHLARGTAP